MLILGNVCLFTGRVPTFQLTGGSPVNGGTYLPANGGSPSKVGTPFKVGTPIQGRHPQSKVGTTPSSVGAPGIQGRYP